MNWNALAQEYTAEANTLARHIKGLKDRLRQSNYSEQNELNRRIALLYTMYLEYRHTGQLLAAHPAALRETQEENALGKTTKL